MGTDLISLAPVVEGEGAPTGTVGLPCFEGGADLRVTRDEDVADEWLPGDPLDGEE